MVLAPLPTVTLTWPLVESSARLLLPLPTMTVSTWPLPAPASARFSRALSPPAAIVTPASEVRLIGVPSCVAVNAAAPSTTLPSMLNELTPLPGSQLVIVAVAVRAQRVDGQRGAAVVVDCQRRRVVRFDGVDDGQAVAAHVQMAQCVVDQRGDGEVGAAAVIQRKGGDAARDGQAVLAEVDGADGEAGRAADVEAGQRHVVQRADGVAVAGVISVVAAQIERGRAAASAVGQRQTADAWGARVVGAVCEGDIDALLGAGCGQAVRDGGRVVDNGQRGAGCHVDKRVRLE